MTIFTHLYLYFEQQGLVVNLGPLDELLPVPENGADELALEHDLRS